MKYLFFGDRNWSEQLVIDMLMAGLSPEEDTIIAGGATGADTLAYYCARRYDIPVEVFKADWNQYGRAAGPIRNQRMLDEGKPHIAFAFHNDLSKSKGTADMLRRLVKANIPTFHVRMVTDNG